MRIAYLETNYNFEGSDYEHFDTLHKAIDAITERCRKVCERYGIKDGSKEFKSYARQMVEEMLAEVRIVDNEACTLYFGGYVVAFRNDARKAFC